MLAPETDATGGSRLAVRLQDGLADAGVAASVGVASSATGDLERAWREADSQMYSDKRHKALVV